MPNPTRQLFVRWQVFLEGARTRGLLQTLFQRTAGDVASAIAWAALLPLTILMHIAGFRRLTVITQRIGHLAAEMDCFAKARRLGELPSRRWLVLAPPEKVANNHLLEYWEQEVIVVSHPLACLVLDAMSRWWLMKQDVSHYILRLYGTHDLYRINAAWKEWPPVLQLTPEDETWAARSFKELGFPPDGWFVCAHVRGPGFSPEDDHAHAHRNSDPLAFVPAMLEIMRRGGWCVRMGDPSMSPLPRVDRVIDYARHPLMSERLDVVLCARASCWGILPVYSWSAPLSGCHARWQT